MREIYVCLWDVYVSSEFPPHDLRFWGMLRRMQGNLQEKFLGVMGQDEKEGTKDGTD
jgi:hypothetical protein